MTDEELLKNIKTIISEEIKAQTNPLIEQMEVFEAQQQYFEQILRSITHGQRTTEQKLENIQQEVKSLHEKMATIQKEVKLLQKEVNAIQETLKDHGKKLNFIWKTVDIIGKRYDERIVENSREIEKIKNHLKLLKN